MNVKVIIKGGANMNIYLFCNAGMSTSLVGSKLKKSYHEIGRTEVEVEAFDFSMLQDVVEEADVIIIGPQIAWAYEDVKRDYPHKKVILLTMAEFGSMNGQVVLERIEKEIM